MKKRGLCINDAQERDDAAEEWLTPVNWEEDPVIKAERRRRNYTKNKLLGVLYSTCWLREVLETDGEKYFKSKLELNLKKVELE